MGTPQVVQNCLNLTQQTSIHVKMLEPPPLDKNILAYQFPFELYERIFSFLDSKSLLGVVKVCKEWNSLEIEVFRLFADQVGFECPKENVEKFYTVLKKHLIFDKTSKKMLVNCLPISRKKIGTHREQKNTEMQAIFKKIIEQMPVETFIHARAGMYFKKNWDPNDCGRVEITNDPELIGILTRGNEGNDYISCYAIDTLEDVNWRYPKTLLALKEIEVEIEKWRQEFKKHNCKSFVSFPLYRVMNLQQHLALLLWVWRKGRTEFMFYGDTLMPEIFKYISKDEMTQLASYDISIEKILYQLGDRFAENLDRLTSQAEKALKEILEEFQHTPVSAMLTSEETNALTLFNTLFLRIPIKESFYRMLQRTSQQISYFDLFSKQCKQKMTYNFRISKRPIFSIKPSYFLRDTK